MFDTALGVEVGASVEVSKDESKHLSFQDSCKPCAQPSGSFGAASSTDWHCGENFKPVFERGDVTFGWWEQTFAQARSLGQTNVQLVPAPTHGLPYRAVCIEKGPRLPKEKGRADSWPINQHKQAPSRSLWPEFCLMTSAVICLSHSQNLLAGAGSVFPCTHDEGTLS